MTALVKYDAAIYAIAEARAVDELLNIRDGADAMRAAARVAKNKQAEIDMAEIRFRAERRLGEMIAAQKSSVGLAQGKRTDLGPERSQVDKPTLADAGIDKHLADRARKLAAIPADEFNGIVGDWRGRVESEHERVTVNLLKAGTKAEQGRRENDFYPTPETLVAEIMSRWHPTTRKVWEPCAGDGRVAAALRKAGYSVVTGDISTGSDFFATTKLPKPGIAICTNPPFEKVREFIDHAFKIGVTEMCLVLPERLWACGAGREQFERHRPSVWVNVDWREDYLGKGGSPDRALAVAIWDSPHATNCQFDVWTRQSALGAETFDPETGEITDTPAHTSGGPAKDTEPVVSDAENSTAARKDVPGSLPVIKNRPVLSDNGGGYPHKDSERPLDTEQGSPQSHVAGAPADTQSPPVEAEFEAVIDTAHFPEAVKDNGAQTLFKTSIQATMDAELAKRAKKQWKHSDPAHRDCLDPGQCGGLSNLALCQRCRDAAGVAA